MIKQYTEDERFWVEERQGMRYLFICIALLYSTFVWRGSRELQTISITTPILVTNLLLRFSWHFPHHRWITSTHTLLYASESGVRQGSHSLGMCNHLYLSKFSASSISWTAVSSTLRLTVFYQYYEGNDVQIQTVFTHFMETCTSAEKSSGQWALPRCLTTNDDDDDDSHHTVAGNGHVPGTDSKTDFADAMYTRLLIENRMSHRRRYLKLLNIYQDFSMRKDI